MEKNKNPHDQPGQAKLEIPAVRGKGKGTRKSSPISNRPKHTSRKSSPAQSGKLGSRKKKQSKGIPTSNHQHKTSATKKSASKLSEEHEKERKGPATPSRRLDFSLHKPVRITGARLNLDFARPQKPRKSKNPIGRVSKKSDSQMKIPTQSQQPTPTPAADFKF